MPGGDDPSNENYGNYQHTGGSIFCYIPAFCYSFTDPTQGLSSKGTHNAFYIKSFSEFEFDEAEANKQGYILHRAFIDGGKTKKGFFVTKYLMGKGCKATKGNIPLSCCSQNLSDATTHAEGGAGANHDAITLSKKLGSQYACESSFMASAISMLSFCHGLFASNDSTCAWYDAKGTTNYPKGCNNNSLGDTNDTSVKYTNSDTKIKQKPNTGSGTPFAKTTHNGQSCGVCDVNGCMRQATTGISNDGGNFYLMKQNLKITDFASNNVNTAAMYNSISYPIPNGTTTTWGAGSTTSFYKDTSGNNRDLCGCLPAPGGYSTSGTNEFGIDRAYVYGHSAGSGWGAFLVAGSWSEGTLAGVWFRWLDDDYYGGGDGWHDSSSDVGFRAAAYGADASKA